MYLFIYSCRNLFAQTLRFQESPVMSTYLVAFVVGEMEFIEGTTAEGVVVRVYATPGKSHLGNFALQVASTFTTDDFLNFFSFIFWFSFFALQFVTLSTLIFLKK